MSDKVLVMKDINNNFFYDQSAANQVDYQKSSQQLATFHAACFANFEKQFSEKSMLFFLEIPRYHVFYNGISLAILQVTSKEVELITLAVGPKHRRNGVGSKLLRIIIQYLKTLRINELFLEVSILNISAIKIYEKIGFKNCGIRKNYYCQGNQSPIDAIQMFYHINRKE